MILEKRRGQTGQRLTFEKPNELVIVLTENFFRSYRGKQQEFVAVVRLDGGTKPQTVTLAPQDFNATDDTALSSWENIDLLSFRAYFDKGDKLVGSKSWSAAQPVFHNLRWTAADPSND